jgi:peptide chain release factor 2
MNDLIKRLENLKSEILNLKSHLSLPQKGQKVLELEEQMQGKDFWADNENAQKVSRDYNQLKKFVDFWDGLEKQTSEVLDLVKQNHDESFETVAYLNKQTEDLEAQYKQNRFIALLSKKYDDHNAIFSIHSGAGGVDAQDWADMLLRMYLRYC